MEPVEFVDVKKEDTYSDSLDNLRIENNCLPFDPFEIEERKQELTNALKYCIDLLKDAQVISDLQNSHGTISRRSQLMGKEIQRRIMDMLCSMDFMENEKDEEYKENEEDEEMIKCKEEPLFNSLEDEEMIKCKEESLFNSLEDLSCDLNSEKEQKHDSIKFVEMTCAKQTRLSIQDRVKILERLDRGETIPI